MFKKSNFRETQPLIIVYQNSTQRERMKEVARNVVFLDATYKGSVFEKSKNKAIRKEIFLLCINHNGTSLDLCHVTFHL